jgi:FSR family fosmidomycin resistance protein-like MFS transporter
MQKEIITTDINKKEKTNPEVMLRTVYHTLAHFSNDVFLAFFAPTLPVLITQMHLLKVQAGILNLGLELTALSMPLVGRLADKKDIRKFMVLTPAITALCMSSLTLIPNFYLLFLVLMIVGLSIYFYHAIGPADIGQVSDKALGGMMAIWNIAGQVGFMIGPMVITAILANSHASWIPSLFLAGIALSVLLYILWGRMPKTAAPAEHAAGTQRKLDSAARAFIVRQFIPIVGINIASSLLRSSAYAYLPVYIVEKGGSLWMSGMAVSLYFGAGILGNYVGGILYDRIGSKAVTAISLLGFSLSFAVTIIASGIVQLLLITVVGTFAFMLMPTMMAMLQKNNPQDRSLTNGLFLGFNYAITALGSVATGFLLDRMPTLTVFMIAAGVALVSLIFVPMLVDENGARAAASSAN